MNLPLPTNTKIKITSDDGSTKIIIPHPKPNILNYLMGVFILFWLGGWFMGFKSASTMILAGQGGAFLIFWIGAWSLGGLMAVYMAYRIFIPSIPESLLLNKPFLTVDTGKQSFNMMLGMYSPKSYWSNLFSKRHHIQIDHDDLNSLKLRETYDNNRLTIDKGNNRVEIAKSATEVEREWLYNYLASHYRLH